MKALPDFIRSWMCVGASVPCTNHSRNPGMRKTVAKCKLANQSWSPALFSQSAQGDSSGQSTERSCGREPKDRSRNAAMWVGGRASKVSETR